MVQRVILALLIGALPAVTSVGLPSAPDSVTESAVFLAVFQQQILEHLDAAERSRGTVICIAIDPGSAAQSPSRDFMARLRDERAVRGAGECDPRPAGAVEATTLRPAIIVTAGPIEWVSADEAWVKVRYFRSARASALRRYRVVKERGSWVTLGPILLDDPV
jgi:hypothetical protein